MCVLLLGPDPPSNQRPRQVLRPAQRQFSISKFKELVDYAYSYNGLHLGTRLSAADWAEKWMGQFGRDDFEEFRKLVGKLCLQLRWTSHEHETSCIGMGYAQTHQGVDKPIQVSTC